MYESFGSCGLRTAQNFQNRNYLIDCCSSDNWLSKIALAPYISTSFVSDHPMCVPFLCRVLTHTHTRSDIRSSCSISFASRTYGTHSTNALTCMLSNIPIKISKILLIYISICRRRCCRVLFFSHSFVRSSAASSVGWMGRSRSLLFAAAIIIIIRRKCNIPPLSSILKQHTN